MGSRKKLNIPVEMTHQEIADVLGITKAAVIDIEQRALRKLRLILKQHGYSIEDFFTWEKK